jgi:nucleotide-binding universal stress UspA family protein
MHAPIRTIVAATDFSPQADRALARAARIALEHGARLELVHAAPLPMPMPVWGDMAGGTWIDNGELAAAGVERMQQQRAALLAEHAIDVTVHSDAGPAARLVMARADELAADLIVIGATGEGAVARRLFGSTAQSIVRQLRRAVLVVRLEATDRYRQLLVASDFSDDADGAAHRARQLAPAAELAVFSALEQPRVSAGWFTGLDEATRAANLQRARETVAGRLRTLAAALGAPDARVVVRDGRASHELPAVLAECGTELLALGAHGKSRLEAGLLGSTTLHAVAEADCDVLVAPPVHRGG